jgi:hypothetical protein
MSDEKQDVASWFDRCFLNSLDALPRQMEGARLCDEPTVKIRYNDATHQWEKVDG